MYSFNKVLYIFNFIVEITDAVSINIFFITIVFRHYVIFTTDTYKGTIMDLQWCVSIPF